ncbi:MAG: OmpH family outer membrane protein [Candidatus Marinimicrobia bacterium]|nr:OmpH family outer membrane protein [Candidatus Neomarinimicrobiota bacterium]
MNIVKLCLITLSVFLIFSAAATAQTKIGYIDSEQIFEKFEEFKFAKQKFEKEAAKAEKDLQYLWAQLDSLQNERDKGRFTWSSSRLAQKDKEIAGKQEKIRKSTEQTFGPGGTIYQTQKQLTQKSMDDIIIALSEIADEEGYEMVFDAARGTIPFKKIENDLTDKVLERLRTGIGKSSRKK